MSVFENLHTTLKHQHLCGHELSYTILGQNAFWHRLA